MGCRNTLHAPSFLEPTRSITRPGHARATNESAPGELVHVGVKKMARVPDGGELEGRPLVGPADAVGSFPYIVVVDFSCVTDAELLGDERGAARAALTGRRSSSFGALGAPVEGGVVLVVQEGPGIRNQHDGARRPYAPSAITVRRPPSSRTGAPRPLWSSRSSRSSPTEETVILRSSTQTASPSRTISHSTRRASPPDTAGSRSRDQSGRPPAYASSRESRTFSR